MRILNLNHIHMVNIGRRRLVNPRRRLATGISPMCEVTIWNSRDQLLQDFAES